MEGKAWRCRRPSPHHLHADTNTGKKLKLTRRERDLQEGSKDKPKPVKGQMKDWYRKKEEGGCRSGLQERAKQEVKKKMECVCVCARAFVFQLHAGITSVTGTSVFNVVTINC